MLNLQDRTTHLPPRPGRRRARTVAWLLSLWPVVGCGLGSVGPDLDAWEAAKAADSDAASAATDGGEAPADALHTDAVAPRLDATSGQDAATVEDIASAPDGKQGQDAVTQPGDDAVAAADSGPADIIAQSDGTADVAPPQDGAGADSVAQDAGLSCPDGATCDDGDPCTFADTCKGGVCLPGAVTSCDDGNDCTADACDKATGCVNKPKANATPCSDGDVCTGGAGAPAGEACLSGICMAGAATTCNDNDPCTKDDCHPTKGCVASLADGATCTDGNACTTADACKDGICAGGGATNCDDGNDCTLDGCETKTGCAHVAFKQDAPCEDNNACTTASTCDKGKCIATAQLKCVAKEACRTVGCDPTKGCVFGLANGNGCDDGSVCTGTDFCVKGTCKPGAPKTCDDKIFCTKDSCDPVKGCQHVAATNMPCDDGSKCTVVDICEAGTCKGHPGLFEAKLNAQASGDHRTTAVVALPAGGFVTHTSTSNPKSFPAVSGTIALRDRAGRGLAALSVPGAPMEVRHIATTDGKNLLAVGHTLSPGPRARALAVSLSGAKLQVIGDHLLESWGSTVADAAAIKGGWLLVGARAPGDSFSEALVASVGVDGKKSWARLERRGHGASLSAIAAGTGAGAAATACGQWQWSALGRSDAWLAQLDSKGDVKTQRRYRWGAYARCRDIVAVKDGFIMVGSSRQDGTVSTAVAQRVDTSGRVQWTRLHSAQIGAEWVAASLTQDGYLSVAGRYERAAPGRPNVPWLANISIRNGATRWQKQWPSSVRGQLLGVAVDDKQHTVAVGMTKTAGGKQEALLTRVGAYGHDDCKTAGTCGALQAKTCGVGSACQAPVCDPKSGCKFVAVSGGCDDGKSCSAGSTCLAGKCQGGSPALGDIDLGEATEARAVAADGEGGQLVVMEQGNKHLFRIGPTGTKRFGIILEPLEVAVVRRAGAHVQVISANEHIDGRMVRADDGKPSAVPALNNLPMLAAVQHEKTSSAALSLAVDGPRVAALGTRLGDTGISIAVLVMSPGWSWSADYKNLVEGKPEFVSLSAGKDGLLGAGVALDPHGGALVSCDRGNSVAGGVEPGLAVRLVRLDDAGKTAWQLEVVGSGLSKEQLQSSGLAVADNGDALWALQRSATTVGGSANFEIRRVDSAKKVRWMKAFTTKVDAASQPRVVFDAMVGDDLLLATPKLVSGHQSAEVHRLEAGAITKTVTLPSSGFPRAISSAWHGAPTLLLFGKKTRLSRITPWLHTTCNAAGQCAEETAISCVSHSECLAASCSAKGGCTTNVASQGKTCQDGDLCVIGAKCDAGACKGGKPPLCNDNVTCSVDRCHPGTGKCAPAYTSMPCDKGNACLAWSCTKNGCESASLSDTICGDGKVCKTGKCVAK